MKEGSRLWLEGQTHLGLSPVCGTLAGRLLLDGDEQPSIRVGAEVLPTSLGPRTWPLAVTMCCGLRVQCSLTVTLLWLWG